jgi:hypothetical protein
MSSSASFWSPEVIINHYLQDKIYKYINEYYHFDIDRYQNKFPILSTAATNLNPEQLRKFEEDEMPYILWSSFSNPRSVPRTIYPIKSGQIMYKIISFTTEELLQIRSFILNVFDRKDESAKDLNDFARAINQVLILTDKTEIPEGKQSNEKTSDGKVYRIVDDKVYEVTENGTSFFHCTSTFQLDFVDQLTNETNTALQEKIIVKYEYHDINIFDKK